MISYDISIIVGFAATVTALLTTAIAIFRQSHKKYDFPLSSNNTIKDVDDSLIEYIDLVKKQKDTFNYNIVVSEDEVKIIMKYLENKSKTKLQ